MSPFLTYFWPRGDYLFALLPIAASHVCVPPLSYLVGAENPPEALGPLFLLIYSLVPKELLSKRFVTSMALDYDPYDKTKAVLSSLRAQHLTYMCVHGNYEHLLNNLYGTFLCGSASFESLGPLHVYAVYLLGGVVSTLPSLLYDRNSGKISLLGSEMVKHVSGTLNVPAPISKPIASAVIMAGDYLSSLIPSLYIGSSGAVSSLMGCSAVISLFKLINEIDYLRRNKHTSYIQSIRNIVFSGAGVLQSIYFILNELYLSDPKALISKESTYFSKFIKIYEVSGTNHVGHVQGFFFGAIYGLAFGVVAPYLWRRRSKVIR